MIATTLLVTICGPHKTLDLELPGDVAVRELLPILLAMCGSGNDSAQALPLADARLQADERASALSLEKTLLDADICDGTVLMLQTNDAPPSLQGENLAPQRFVPRSMQPGVDTGGVGVRWTPL